MGLGCKYLTDSESSKRQKSKICKKKKKKKTSIMKLYAAVIYDEVDIDGSATSVILKRESGLIPLTTSMFEVRAQCGDNLGKWKAISRYIGEWRIFDQLISAAS